MQQLKVWVCVGCLFFSRGVAVSLGNLTLSCRASPTETDVKEPGHPSLQYGLQAFTSLTQMEWRKMVRLGFHLLCPL